MPEMHERVTDHLALALGLDLGRMVSALYRLAEANVILGEQVKALSALPPEPTKEDA